MTDLSTLERDTLAAIAAAPDEAALEAVRIAALGKAGAISGLLKTLGAMTPDERKEQGPLINGLRDRVTAALATAPGWWTSCSRPRSSRAVKTIRRSRSWATARAVWRA
jgi:phenylalanyl-tRNA synthetase alpha subunit